MKVNRHCRGRIRRRGQLLIAVTGLFGFALFLAGCGEPGDDGEAYIAYSWAVGPITFYTEDPAFSGDANIYNGEYKKTRPGTHYFEYVAWDGSSWYGEYEIYREEGEDGSLFSDGEDGEDLYFELACYSFGPSFYVWNDPDIAGAAVDTPQPVALLGAAVGRENSEEARADIAPSGVADRREGRAGPGRVGPQAEPHIFEGDTFTLILRYQKEDQG